MAAEGKHKTLFNMQLLAKFSVVFGSKFSSHFAYNYNTTLNGTHVNLNGLPCS